MSFNMDRLAASIVNLVVKGSKRVSFEVWQPGEKLRILLVGYNGKRNTGADVRVVPMVDQFNHILGKENIEIGIMTLNIKNSEVYYQPPTNAELVEFSSVYFMPLLKQCSSYHLAALSEGSCLKSKFANALTLFFIEAAGVMREQGKPCIAYGSEAGDMDAFVYKLAQKLCTQTYFIARTKPSLEIIRSMGLKGEIGTDTAWLFPPTTKEWAEKELKEKAGWDGKKPIIGVAPINPFFWPVRPNLVNLMTLPARRKLKDYHYEKYYFYTTSKERRRDFDNYITGIASSVDEFARAHNAQVIIIGMDFNDFIGYSANACLSLQKALKTPAQIFDSMTYDGYQITAILRSLSMLITSRYHARVLSMPAGVPSLAVSMDERLRNLLEESGHLRDYYFEVDESGLGEKLLAGMEKIWENREKVSKEIRQTIPNYLKLMANMGATFRGFIKENFPQFPLPSQPTDWLDYLPPLSPELSQIVKDMGG